MVDMIKGVTLWAFLRAFNKIYTMPGTQEQNGMVEEGHKMLPILFLSARYVVNKVCWI